MEFCDCWAKNSQCGGSDGAADFGYPLAHSVSWNCLPPALLQRDKGHPSSPVCHSPSVYTAVAGSEGQWHPSVMMSRSRGLLDRRGRGFPTSSGTLPYISLMALEERHLGVGLYAGSLSSQLLRGSLPTSAFCSHSGVGCYGDPGRKKNIVAIVSLLSYLVTNLHQQLGQEISWSAQRGQF